MKENVRFVQQLIFFIDSNYKLVYNIHICASTVSLRVNYSQIEVTFLFLEQEEHHCSTVFQHPWL